MCQNGEEFPFARELPFLPARSFGGYLLISACVDCHETIGNTIAFTAGESVWLLFAPMVFDG
jgi:uncharacterized membrane protein